MQYLLMLYADEKAGAEIPPEDMAGAMQEMAAYQAGLEKAGAFIGNSGLQPTWEAHRPFAWRAVRSRSRPRLPGHVYFANEGGELKVHDGPYAETREQLGGYYIIEAVRHGRGDWLGRPLPWRAMGTGRDPPLSSRPWPGPIFFAFERSARCSMSSWQPDRPSGATRRQTMKYMLLIMGDANDDEHRPHRCRTPA